MTTHFGPYDGYSSLFADPIPTTRTQQTQIDPIQLWVGRDSGSPSLLPESVSGEGHLADFMNQEGILPDFPSQEGSRMSVGSRQGLLSKSGGVLTVSRELVGTGLDSDRVRLVGPTILGPERVGSGQVWGGRVGVGWVGGSRSVGMSSVKMMAQE